MMRQLAKRLVPRSLRWQLRKAFMDFRGWQYRGDAVTCPCCQKSYAQFMPMTEGTHQREGVVCPGCAVVERHRLLMLWLKEKSTLYTQPHKVLYFAPEYSMQKHLQSLSNVDYLSTDIDSTLAMQEFDIMDIPHPDNTFSMIFCSHVLAHVRDDQQALHELYRILKPGGQLIILDRPDDIPTTIEDPNITSVAERTKLYLQHDRWRRYGQDYVQRIEQHGFKVTIDDYATQLSDVQVKQYVIDRSEMVYICEK